MSASSVVSEAVSVPRASRPSRLPGWLRRLGAWPWFSLVVVLWALACYAVTYFAFLDRIDPYFYMYVAEPLLWGSLALLGLLGWKCLPQDRPSASRSLVLITVLLGAAQVSVSLLAGLVFGFGYSPYSHGFPYILGNLLFAATFLLGFEMSRAYLVVWLDRRRPALALVAVSVFFFLLQVAYGKYRLLFAGKDVLSIGAGWLLPTLAQSLAATYLAMLGGPLAALGYLGTLQAFEWLSPILPKLGWQVMAFLGTLMPVVVVTTVRSLFAKPGAEASDETEGSSFTGWIIVAVVAVALIWLNTGILGVQPTLVGSGSMSPTIDVGDVVILKDVEPAEVAVGDVVRFNRGGLDVIHRVVAIEQGAGGLTFTTRGDANNSEDAPFEEAALKGKVIATVPKIGWIAIWLCEGVTRLGSVLG